MAPNEEKRGTYRRCVADIAHDSRGDDGASANRHGIL